MAHDRGIQALVLLAISVAGIAAVAGPPVLTDDREPVDLALVGMNPIGYPTFALPTGDAARGLGNGRAQLLLPLWAQRSSGEPTAVGSNVSAVVNVLPHRNLLISGGRASRRVETNRYSAFLACQLEL